MEFTNEIFFNKPLIAGTTVIITYSGKLYREHSKDVTIVYGYGDNWEFTDSSPMVETDNGFEVTITLKDYNTFNFCFSNSFNIWDNNSGFNYIAPISPKKETNDQVLENDNVQENINSIEDTTEEVSEDIVSEETEKTEEVTEEAKKVEKISTTDSEKENIEIAFSSLLDSLLDDIQKKDETVDISNLSGFGLQSVDTVKEEETIDDIFSKLFEELTVESSKQTTSQIETTSNDKIEDELITEPIIEKMEENDNIQTETILEEETPNNEISEIEPITEEYSDNQTTSLEENEVINYDKYEMEELDTLMDNLLEAISNKDNSFEPSTPLQKIEIDDLENVGLPAVQYEEDWIDKIINISFNFTKKITNAFKKFGHLIKLKAQEYGIINNDK